MSSFTNISSKERTYLRELARRYMEYASLPVQAECTQLWFDHNDLHDTRPPVVIEMWSFEEDLLPPPSCTSSEAKKIEHYLVEWIANHEQVGDDKVIPPYFPVYWQIEFAMFGYTPKWEYRADSRGLPLAHTQRHPVVDVTTDLEILERPSTMTIDREATLAFKALVEDVLGDIIPVKLLNRGIDAVLPYFAFLLMGSEGMWTAMLEHPEEMHHLYRRIKEEHQAYHRWMEHERLLTPNDGYQQIPSGGYCFTHDLPALDLRRRGTATMRDCWLHLSSQEMTGTSRKCLASSSFLTTTNWPRKAGSCTMDAATRCMASGMST